MACVGVCGSVNMDIFGYVPRLPAPGETLRGTRLAYAPGGKGANQAVAAARAGAVVRFTSACGRDDFGDELAAALDADGVDLTGMRRVDDPTGVAIILVDDDGENQIAVIPGANDAVEAPVADPAVGVWLVQAEVPLAAVKGTLAAARATGATALVNASPAGRIPPAIVARYDIAIVNETELEALGDDHPPHIVLTLGSRGVRILPENIALPAIPARVVDTTGAGDALAGTAAAALAEGRTLEEAVGWGIAAASLSVERHGCQPAMPRRDEIETRLRGAASA
jgi:ribokinase